MIKVSAATAATLADMQKGLDGISDVLEKLTLRLDVLEEQWDGEAREAFAVAQREWNANMAELHALAARVRRRAQQHVDDFGAFDSRRSSAWTR